jgi:lipoprotein signal peptidase
MILVILFIIDKIIKVFIINSGGLIFVNNGMLFGIIIEPVFFLSILIVISLLVLNYYHNELFRSPSIKIIVFGAVLNITDRLIWGGVVDYINIFRIFIINPADVIIMVGILYLIYSKYVSGKKYIINS